MFNGAPRLRFHGCDVIVLTNTSDYRDQLDSCREDLLRLATFARGWGPEELPRMREVFKIEPFYRATSLALVFRDGRLCGTAGVDTDFGLGSETPAILHLCSVNLLDQLKNSGFPALFMLLLSDALLERLAPGQAVYFTSISQSPLVYRMLSRLARVFPDGRQRPPADVRNVARIVAAKYDPDVPLDADRLVLLGECDFFYRQLPLVADARINALFDAELDISRGDVFVNVGKTSVAAARAVAEKYRHRVATIVEQA